jgi:hypothetical protein
MIFSAASALLYKPGFEIAKSDGIARCGAKESEATRQARNRGISHLGRGRYVRKKKKDEDALWEDKGRAEVADWRQGWKGFGRMCGSTRGRGT